MIVEMQYTGEETDITTWQSKRDTYFTVTTTQLRSL